MLEGNIINLRLVEEEDAEFIVDLRTNQELSKFISSTSIDIYEQKNWIKDYKIREKNKEEFYFIVENKDKTSCGTIRIYNINYEIKRGTWGSFILGKMRPEGASNEVIELSLKFAFEKLKLKKMYLDVRKENYKAIHIYEKNGFIRLAEDRLNLYYIIEKATYLYKDVL